MSLKLKVSRASGVCSPKAVPYLIVGSDEFRDVSPKIKLTVVDAIIGELLAQRACHEHFFQGFDPEQIEMDQAYFEDLSDADKHEVISDWVMANEVAFEAEHSPLFSANGRLRRMLRDRGIFQRGWSLDYRCEPPIPEGLSPVERMARIDAAHRIGITHRLHYSRIEPGQKMVVLGSQSIKEFPFVERTVWLPNLYSLGVAMLELGSEIGHMLCQMELKTMFAPVRIP